MGYEEVLRLLEQQLNSCKDKEDYLSKQKEIALKSKDIATLIGVNIASVAVQIRKMIKRDQIKVIKGLDVDKSKKVYNTRHYVLSSKYVEEEELLK